MDIIIAEADAIRTYRVARAEKAAFRVEPTNEVPGDFSQCTSRRFKSLVASHLIKLGIMFPGKPIHLRFPSVSARIRIAGVCSHVCSSDLPPSSFWRIVPEDRTMAEMLRADGIRLFVDSPQLCVIFSAAQARRTCSEGKLTKRVVPVARAIATASEFIGTYSLAALNPQDVRPQYGINALITRADLRDYLAHTHNVDGLRDARIACDTCVDGQASPAEVALHAGMILRPGLGGFHLERPVANAKMQLSDQQLQLMKHEQITPDFYWKRYGLVIEYDGGDHFTSAAAREDKRRLFDYQSMQLVILPATAEDMRSVDAFDSFIRVVERVMERKDGPKLRRRVNKILANKEARLCRSLLLSAIQTAA